MIRYYEYADDKFEFLSEYKSADPQRGVAFLPKRGVNVGIPLPVLLSDGNKKSWPVLMNLVDARK